MRAVLKREGAVDTQIRINCPFGLHMRSLRHGRFQRTLTRINRNQLSFFFVIFFAALTFLFVYNTTSFITNFRIAEISVDIEI